MKDYKTKEAWVGALWWETQNVQETAQTLAFKKKESERIREC